MPSATWSGGNRQDDLRHTSFRGVVGVKGDIFKYWDYDVFVQTGKVIYQETYKNDFSLVRSGRALDVVSDANGNPVCRSVLDGSDPNCVPYNIFKLGGVTPAALLPADAGLQEGLDAASRAGCHPDLGPGQLRGQDAMGEKRRRRCVRRRAPCREARSRNRRGVRQRRPRGTRRADPRSRRAVHRQGSLRRSQGAAHRRGAVGGSAQREWQLPVFGLQHQPHDRQLRSRCRVGPGQGREAPRQLPAGGARRECDRAVHRAGARIIQLGQWGSLAPAPRQPPRWRSARGPA